jgi:hypothetical protein
MTVAVGRARGDISGWLRHSANKSYLVRVR